MKKRTFAILSLTLVLLLAAGIFAACDGKTNSSVRFDLGGVGENVTLTGKAGSAAAAPHATDGEDWYFGGWYDNASFEGDAIQTPLFPSSGEAVYFARWYVSCKVDILLQNLDLESYDKSEELSFTKHLNKGSVPENLRLELEPVEGFELQSDDMLDVAIEGRDTSVELKFDRAKAPVNYHYNVDDDSSALPEDFSEDYVYGQTADISDEDFDFSVMRELGYRYVGLSYTADGAELLAEDEKATLSGALDVYAIWDKAYVDRAGGVDFVYLPEREPGVAYFDRYGYASAIEGTYNENTQICEFDMPDGAKRQVKIYDDGTFQADRGHSGRTITLYDKALGAGDDGVAITFGSFDAVRVTVAQDKGGALFAVERVRNAFEDSYVKFELPAGTYVGTYSYDPIFEDLSLNLAGHTYHVKERSDGTFAVRGVEAGYYVLDIDSLDYVVVLDGYGMYADSDDFVGTYEVAACESVNFGSELISIEKFVSKVTVTISGDSYPIIVTSFSDMLDLDDDDEYDDAFLGVVLESDGYQGTFGFFNVAQGAVSPNRSQLTIGGFGRATVAPYTDDQYAYDYQLLYEDVIAKTNLGFAKFSRTINDEEESFTAILDYYNEYYIRLGKDASIYALTQIDDLTGKKPAKIIVVDGEDVYVFDGGEAGTTYTRTLTGTVSFENATGVYSASFENAAQNFRYYLTQKGGVEIAAKYVDINATQGGESDFEPVKVYDGTFTAADGALMKLDAFGNAEFSDANGRVHKGDYFYSPKFDQCTFICPELWYSCVMFNFTVDEQNSAFAYKMTIDSELRGKSYLYAPYDPVSHRYFPLAMLQVGENGYAEIHVNISTTSMNFQKALIGRIEFENAYYYHFKFIPDDIANADIPSQLVPYFDKMPELTGEFVFGFTYAGDTVYMELPDEYKGEYEVSYRSETVRFIFDGFDNATAYVNDKIYGGYYEAMKDEDGLLHFRFMSQDDIGNLYFDENEDGTYSMREAEYIPDGYYLTDLENIFSYKLILDGYSGASIALYSNNLLFYMAEGDYVLDDHGKGKVTNIVYDVWKESEEDGISAELAQQLNNLAQKMREQFKLENEFDFTLVTMTYGKKDMECFIMHKPEWKKSIVLSDGATFTGDGIYSALYIDSNGDAQRGQYYVESRNDENLKYQAIRFLASYGDDRTFLIEEDGSVREVGNEFGYYTLLTDDLQEDASITLQLDGEGNAIYNDGAHVYAGTYEFEVFVEDGQLLYYVFMTATSTDDEQTDPAVKFAFSLGLAAQMFVVDDEFEW